MQQIDKDSFKEVIQGVAGVQFSATWCHPCKNLTKTISNNANDFDVDFYKIDLDESQELATQFSVRSVPTLILFKEGKEVKRVVGDKSVQQIKSFLSE